MTADHFEATFVIAVDRARTWERLTERPLEAERPHRKYWLAGFDSATTVEAEESGALLRVTKDDQPCAGTEIVVTLADAGTGTRITVVQSRFGDWMPPLFEMMSVGWRHIVADLQTYLSIGVHASRHLRPWGDLGADVASAAGGLRIGKVRGDTLADRLGLRADDLLLVLANAPVSSCDDLVTVLRVLDGRGGPVEAEWARDGELQHGTAHSLDA